MKYYLIVGEASGDLHASHLMSALKTADPQSRFSLFRGRPNGCCWRQNGEAL